MHVQCFALLDVSEIRNSGTDCDSVTFWHQCRSTIGDNRKSPKGIYGQVCIVCNNVKKSTKKKKTCETYITHQHRTLGDVQNTEIFRTNPNNYDFEKSLNPSVPIIQCHGFNVVSGNSGGPVFNLSEQLVRMIHVRRIGYKNW